MKPIFFGKKIRMAIAPCEQPFWKTLSQLSGFKQNESYAEKSAAPVAAFVASLLRVAPQTAPLCPSNVPIQSPVSPCRSIGLPSETQHCEISPL